MKSCVLFTYCGQENATFRSHFHTTWGTPFRDSLYTVTFNQMCLLRCIDFGFSLASNASVQKFIGSSCPNSGSTCCISTGTKCLNRPFLKLSVWCARVADIAKAKAPSLGLIRLLAAACLTSTCPIADCEMLNARTGYACWIDTDCIIQCALTQ